MAVQWILGRAGSGKTDGTLDEIRERLQQSPEGAPLIMLVPEQATFQRELDLVSAPGIRGTMRAQVLSFHRLAYRVLQEVGGALLPPVDDTGKQFLLYRTLRQLEDQLKQFKRDEKRTGFIDQLRTFYDELKRHDVAPDQLRMQTAKLVGARQGKAAFYDKMHDLNLVYESYDEMLRDYYTDKEELLDMLAARIPSSHYVEQAEIWVDGFNGFTPQEMKVLTALMKHARKVNITLLLDREYSEHEVLAELEHFHPTARTMTEIQQMIEDEKIKRLPTVFLPDPERRRFARNPSLAHLEREFVTRKRYESVPDDSIQLISAATRRAEIEAAAREMIRLVRDEQYRWRDIAVMVRDTGEWQDELQALLRSYEIPFFFDQKRSVLDHPAVEFIRSALEVILHHWRYEDVFRCVKTGIFEAERQSLDELENHVLACGIQGSKWKYEQVWTYIAPVPLDEEEYTPSPERIARGEEKMRRINDAKELITKPLDQFEDQIKHATTVQDKLTALHGLLESVQLADRLEQWRQSAIDQGDPERAREHGQLWERIVDLIDQLDEVMGEEEISLEMFAGLLETGLESIKLGLVPPALDQVLVGDLERTRLGRIKCAFLLGMNDGVLPQRGKEDGAITEDEREWLAENGLPLAPGSRRRLLDEQFVMYTTLTIPSERLWVSYPISDEEGKALQPSEVIRRLQHMFPHIQERFVMAKPAVLQEGKDQLAFVAHPVRSLSFLVCQFHDWLQGSDMHPIWRDVYEWAVGSVASRERLAPMLRGLFYTNRERALQPDTREALYGTSFQTSVSHLETYMSCPFKQFISHGLRLQERKIYRLEAPDIGQLFHAALKVIAVELDRQRISWSDLDMDACRRFASDAVDQLSPRLQNEILHSSKRYRYISYKLKQVVSRASIVLSEHAKRGHFVPVGLEVDFGRFGLLPPLSFELVNGTQMELSGRIDRVDQAYSGSAAYLRIIDYKSSAKRMDLPEVFFGLSLQMLTYLDVVITHAHRWLGHDAEPAGVLYFHVHNPLIQTKNPLNPEEARKEWFKRYKMQGWVLADADVASQMDESIAQGSSDLVPVQIKKDGTFSKTSSVIEPEQWERLRGFTRHTLRRIGTELTDGKVDVSPYRLGQKTPCTFCSYRSVCQFDSSFDGNSYRDLKAPDKESLWMEIEKKGRN